MAVTGTISHESIRVLQCQKSVRVKCRVSPPFPCLACTSKHPNISLASASLSPVSPLDNIFALPAEVFSSCLAIVSSVMVVGLFLWPALRYGTGYQVVWEIRPSAETPSSVHWRRFYFQLARIHSALELFGRCIYKFTYLLSFHSHFFCAPLSPLSFIFSISVYPCPVRTVCGCT